jgi:hypothetical protein
LYKIHPAEEIRNLNDNKAQKEQVEQAENDPNLDGAKCESRLAKLNCRSLAIATRLVLALQVSRL